MVSDKVFFDANALLEILLKRTNSKAVESFIEENPDTEKSLSTLSGHLLTHFRPKDIQLHTIEKFLQDFNLLSLTSDDFTWAFDAVRNSDFEGALQIAVAIRNGCNTFVTFDKKLAQDYGNLPTLKIKLLC